MAQTSPNLGVLDSFDRGFHTARRVYYLAVVPLLIDLVFLTGRFVQSTNLYSFRIGAKFTLPFYLPSLTDVYDFPIGQGISIQLTGSNIFPVFGIGVILYTAINAYVSAGYLGSLYSSIAGMAIQPSFFSLAAKYFTRILAFGLLWLGLILFSIVLLLSSPFVFAVYLVFFFVFGYFLFLTPFIIVADNANFSKAIEASIKTAAASRTLEYAILYGLATGLISILVYLILNIGFLGFIIAIIGFAFLGTGLVASTFHFIARPTTSVQAPETTSSPTYLGPQN